MARRRMVYWAVATFLVVVGSVFAIGWYGCEMLTHPELGQSPYTLPQYPHLPVEDVYFKSRDGVRLGAWFFPGTNGATIILAHGMGSERSSMLPHANYLHKDGFSVLLFDFRYRGEHEGDEYTGGVRERWDVEGAVDYLKTRSDVDATRIGVQGGSGGAVSAILATGETPEIKGVVAHTPFTSVPMVLNHVFPILTRLPSFPFAPVARRICEFRLDVDFEEMSPIKFIGKISPRPIFLIDEGLDQMFPCNSVELLYKAAGEPKEFWSVPDAEHGTAWKKAPEEYERRVLAFWRDTLGKVQTDSPHKGSVIQ